MKTCTLPHCSAPHYGHGLCQMHWLRTKRGADLTAPKRRRIPGSLCTAPGCSRPHSALGLCSGHLRRLERGASLDGPLRPDRPCALCGSLQNKRRNTPYCGPECARAAWSIHRYAPGVVALATRDRKEAIRRARALLAIGYRRLSQVAPTRPGSFATMKRGSLYVVRWMERSEQSREVA